MVEKNDDLDAFYAALAADPNAFSIQPVQENANAELRDAFQTVLKTNENQEKSRVEKDVLTGGEVTNIPFESPSDKQTWMIGSGLQEAVQIAKKGHRVNILSLIESCDRVGPFPGFKRVLSKEQVTALDNADLELCIACSRQFDRLFKLHKTKQLIRTANAGIEREIVPLLEKIRNAKARDRIAKVIDDWRGNMQSPYQNLFAATNNAPFTVETETDRWGQVLVQANPRCFSVSPRLHLSEAKDGYREMASYHPSSRIVDIPFQENIRFGFTQMLIAMHELSHASYHSDFIQQGNDPLKYHEAYASNAKAHCTILEDESIAYANMLELLKAKSSAMGKPGREAQVIQETNAYDDSDQKTIRTLCEIGEKYFDQNSGQNGEYTESFVREMISRHSSKNEKVVFLKDVHIL